MAEVSVTHPIVDYLPAVHAVARRLAARLPVTGAYDVDDLTQEGVLRVLRAEANGGIDSEDYRIAQACVAARYGMIDALRSSGPIHFTSLNEPDQGDGIDRIHLLISPDAGPEQEAFLGELRARFDEAIETLDTKSQRVLRLHYFEGYNLTKIGQMLSLTGSQISRIHTTSLARLRAWFSPEPTACEPEAACRVPLRETHKIVRLALTDTEIAALRKQAKSQGLRLVSYLWTLIHNHLGQEGQDAIGPLPHRPAT